jgi:hypothetical protein
MAQHWPRIYRFLDRRADIEYHFRDLPVADMPGSWGQPWHLSPTAVALVFHPELERKSRSLLLGTLAHEGLHGIRFAVAHDWYLPPKQMRRLIQKHWTGRRPPGYGARLEAIHQRAKKPGETGIELLTNKLLINRGLDPLTRTLPNGDYVGIDG